MIARLLSYIIYPFYLFFWYVSNFWLAWRVLRLLKNTHGNTSSDAHLNQIKEQVQAFRAFYCRTPTNQELERIIDEVSQ